MADFRVVRRPRRALTAAAAPKSPLTAVVASVAPVTDPAKQLRTSFAGLGGRRQDWQTEAWGFYDLVGEFRFFVGWKAEACGRCRLVASEVGPDGIPTGSVAEDDAAGQELAAMVGAIAGGPAGQSQMVRRLVEVLSVPGEVWLAIIVLPTGERWVALSRDEITVTSSGGVEFELPDGGKHVFDRAAGDGLLRIWKPHPKKASLADSSVRACLGPLREIVASSATIDQAAGSRLANNGILFIPSETSLPAGGPPRPMAGPGGVGAGGDVPQKPVDVPIERQLQDLIVETAQEAVKDPTGAAAITPIVAAAPGEVLKNIVHLPLRTDVTDVALHTRDKAIARLAMGLDMSPERLTGMGKTNHWCVDTDTEILTQRGWLTNDRLQVGDLALGIDPETGLSTWTPVTDVYRADVVDEPMLSMQTHTHSSLTTMSHRWLTANRWTDKLRFKTSARLRSEDLIPTAAPHRDTPDTAKFSDEFVELMAWYWTEGSHGSSVTIAQSHTRNPERVARIRNCLTKLIGPASQSRMSNTTPEWREVVQANRSSYGGPVTVFRLNSAASAELRSWAPGKRVDLEFVRHLTRAQLELFIDVSAQGDGQHYRQGSLDMWQRAESAVEAYELALILSGRMVQRQQIDGGHRVGVWKRTAVNPVKAAIDRNSTAASVRVQPYTGTVWCPVTRTGTWFARRNGKSFFTGNSIRGIEDQDVQLYIKPPLQLVCQAIYAAVLAPMLKDRGIDPDRYTLWFDASQITADPDKTAEAEEAYQAGTITHEAYLRYKGLAEDSAYDLDTVEGLRVWAWDRVSADPTLLPTLAPLLGSVVSAIDFPAPAALPSGDGAAADTPPPDPGQQEPAAGQPASVEAAMVATFAARALELAGKRRVNTRDDDQRERLRGTPAHLYHRLMGPVAEAEVPRLIAGWDSTFNDDLLAGMGLAPLRVRAAVVERVRRELTAAVVDGQVI